MNYTLFRSEFQKTTDKKMSNVITLNVELLWITIYNQGYF